MKANRIGIHLTSVILLALWGGIMLYFYASGRVIKYLQVDGIFHPMLLIGGIGLLVLALFNLVTMGAEESDCCDHDHGHSHDKEHDHDHDHGCCGGHDHAHDHDHGHDHAHKEGEACCGHDHSHDHEHKHDHGGCGHDHGHDHGHSHDHAGHAHGLLDESGPVGRLVAILILAVPVSFAAVRTPDQFSIHTFTNKGGYTNVVDAAGAQQHSIKNKAPGTDVAAKPSAPAPAAAAKVADAPPAAVATAPSAASQPPSSPLPPATTTAQSTPPTASTPPVSSSAPPSGAKDSKSYGGFTLADLEAQVPKSKAGNFVLEVPELYYTAGDKEVQAVLAGQPVETVAQVLPEKVNNADGKRLRVFRMQIQCCAADARPYSIPVAFPDKAPTFKDMTWVKVSGKMSYEKANDQIVPVLQAISMEETTAPDNATMY